MLQTKRGQAAALIAAAFALSAFADSPMAPTSEGAVRLPTTVAWAARRLGPTAPPGVCATPTVGRCATPSFTASGCKRSSPSSAHTY